MYDIVAMAQPLADAVALTSKRKDVEEVRNSYNCFSDINPAKAVSLDALKKLEAELAKLEKKAPALSW